MNKFVRIQDVAATNPPSTKLNDEDLVTFLPMQAVSETGRIISSEIRSYKKVKKGFTPFKNKDVLVAKITPCFENYKGCLADNLENGYGFGSTEFHVLRTKLSVLPEYLYLITRTSHFRGTGELNMTGSAGQKRVPSHFIKNYRFYLPSLSEQKAIVELISEWATVTEKTEKLIEAKKKFKQANIQNLITSKKANAPLSVFLNPVTRSEKKPTKSYTALGIRSHFKGTFHREVKNPDTVSMDTLYRVRENDLIVNITFAWEGAIALVRKEDEHCYVSHRFPTYKIKLEKAVPSFIRQIIQTERMKYNLANISPGGAGRNRVLNKKDFLKLKIWLPDLETQNKIGSLLGAIDKEIELLELLVRKYKVQKRGLMQKLLTGEWRVNAAKEVA